MLVPLLERRYRPSHTGGEGGGGEDEATVCRYEGMSNVDIAQ
jgi:hypothetical protein